MTDILSFSSKVDDATPIRRQLKEKLMSDIKTLEVEVGGYLIATDIDGRDSGVTSLLSALDVLSKGGVGEFQAYKLQATSSPSVSLLFSICLSSLSSVFVHIHMLMEANFSGEKRKECMSKRW